MPNLSALHWNPKKLLLNQWATTRPMNKEKRFWIPQPIKCELHDVTVEHLELEAIYSGHSAGESSRIPGNGYKARLAGSKK